MGRDESPANRRLAGVSGHMKTMTGLACLPGDAKSVAHTTFQLHQKGGLESSIISVMPNLLASVIDNRLIFIRYVALICNHFDEKDYG
jgi:hypothetical protein